MPKKETKTSKTLKDSSTTRRRITRDEILSQKILSDYVVDILKGISMYSQRSRRVSLTDKDVDEFVIETLSYATASNAVRLEKVQTLLERAKSAHERAKTLYFWSCEFCQTQPEELSELAEQPIPSTFNEMVHMARQALDRWSAKDREALFWEKVCVQKLGRIAGLVSQATPTSLEPFKKDIYDFFHECLNLLAYDADVMTLVMLKTRIEKVHRMLIKNLMTGDTLNARPNAKQRLRGVNVSKIISITPPPIQPVSSDTLDAESTF